MYNKDHLIKKLAIDKGIPEWKVKAVYDYYWDTVYQELNSFKHEAIFVRNLGTFALTPKTYYRALQKSIDRYRVLRKNPEAKITIAEKANLEKLLKLRSTISKRLLYDNRISKTDTESDTECGQDSGGSD